MGLARALVNVRDINMICQEYGKVYACVEGKSAAARSTGHAGDKGSWKCERLPVMNGKDRLPGLNGSTVWMCWCATPHKTSGKRM